MNIGNFNTNYILSLCAFVGILINFNESRVDCFHILVESELDDATQQAPTHAGA